MGVTADWCFRQSERSRHDDRGENWGIEGLEDCWNARCYIGDVTRKFCYSGLTSIISSLPSAMKKNEITQ